MALLLLLAASAGAADLSVDLPALDAAIARCDRDVLLPLFASEVERRSAFTTAAYVEQAAIVAERASLAERRRAMREAAMHPQKQSGAQSGETEQALALAQLIADDRQRALDDRRRLETMRQEAVDLKRQYFLIRCTSPRKRD